jgi:hypothetical protein
MADEGHEEQSPSPRSNAGFWFSKPTFVGTLGNRRNAPKAGIRFWATGKTFDRSTSHARRLTAILQARKLRIIPAALTKVSNLQISWLQTADHKELWVVAT